MRRCRPPAARDFSCSARHAVRTEREVRKLAILKINKPSLTRGLLWIMMETSMWMIRTRTGLPRIQMVRTPLVQ